MTIEHVVVPTEKCYYGYKPGFDVGGFPIRCDQAPEDGARRFRPCDGCLGDGRRALLDQAVPVEPQAWLYDSDRTVMRWERIKHRLEVQS